MHRVSKGAPEQVKEKKYIHQSFEHTKSLQEYCDFAASQILNLVHNKSEAERRVHFVIDKYAEQGLRSIAVAYQVSKPPFSISFKNILHFLNVLTEKENSKFPRERKIVPEILGNSLASYHYLTLLDMTVLKQ